MSLEKKLDIIAEIRQGKSQRAVLDRFGVTKSTVGDIWKNKEKTTHLLRLKKHHISSLTLHKNHASM